MRRQLLALVEKEVKDLLRDPRIYVGLAVPLLMFPLMGYLMEMTLGGLADMSVRNLPVAVLNADEGPTGGLLIAYMNAAGLNTTLTNGTLQQAIARSREEGLKAVIVIPSEFTSNLTASRRARVDVYYVIEKSAITEVAASGGIEAVLFAFSRYLSDQILSSASSGLSPEFSRDPLSVTSASVLRGHEFDVNPSVLLGRLSTQGMFVPLIMFVLSTVVAQVAATATAVENEEKTLETLLTLPVPRFHILMGKLAGSVAVAVIGAILYLIGFVFYMGPVSDVMPGEPSGVSITGGGFQPLIEPPAEAYFALAISLLVAVLFTTSLGVIIGALSSDVRIATSLIGVVVVPTLVPFFVVSIAGDLSVLPLPLQLLVYALPTTYPIVAGREILLGAVPSELVWGVPYSLILTVLVILVTSRLLSTEKILALQHKISGITRRTRRAE